MRIQTEKPFEALAEGFILKNSRGDRTPIELFWTSVREWSDRFSTIVKELTAKSRVKPAPTDDDDLSR